MPISVLNWAVAQTILQRDRPDADPADIARFSLLAALVPGVAGLILPFAVEDSLSPPHTTGTTGTTGGTGTTGTTGGTGTTGTTGGTTTGTASPPSGGTVVLGTDGGLRQTIVETKQELENFNVSVVNRLTSVEQSLTEIRDLLTPPPSATPSTSTTPPPPGTPPKLATTPKTP